MVKNDSATLEREEYPGELHELRAALAAIAKHGCLKCQLEASVAAARTNEPPRPHHLLRLEQVTS